MVLGILFVLGACFVWGLIYIIPEMLIGFSPVEVAMGQYFFFGLVALALLLFGKNWKHIRHGPQIWIKALYFALISNVIYYIMLVLGIRYASPSVAALIYGTSPIVISFYGSWREGHASYKSLIIPTFLIAIGLVMINWEAITLRVPHGSLINYIFGLLCSFGAVGAWSWFIASNVKFLSENPKISHSNWTLVMGLATMAWVLLIAAILWMPNVQKFLQLSHDSTNLIWGSLTFGFAASWIGFYLWNKAAALLPVSFAGQLTVFETIFGLIFVFSYEQRLPSPFEMAGIISMLSAIIFSLTVYQHKDEETLEHA